MIGDIEATQPDPDSFGGAFSRAASPARYMVERGDWKGAARSGRQAEQISAGHGDLAISPARSAPPAPAIRPPPGPKSPSLSKSATSCVEAKSDYWAEQVDVQMQTANAWVLYADGKYDDALKAMSAAADAEDKTEKAPVTPGPLAPARELYGFMLLDRGMAKEALAAFEATKAKEPNRFNGYRRRGQGGAGAWRQGEREGEL